MADQNPEDTERQEKVDELSAKLDHAGDIVSDLIKVYRAYGEHGPAAVFRHTEQLSEEELRLTVTAMVAYITLNNAAVAQMFAARGEEKERLL